MKLLVPLLAVFMTGCQQSTPGGATAGSTAGQSVGEAAALERNKSLRSDQSTRSSIQTTASSVIFQTLSVSLPPGIDQSIAKRGSDAFVGTPAKRVLQAMAIAARPTMAWPLDPVERDADARRWAATIGAAVQVASVASATIASQLPARSSITGPDLEKSVLQAFEALPLDALSRQLDELAKQRVLLDMAETSAVRAQLADGGSLSLDSTGATLIRSGAIRFAFAGGVLDGSNYMMALDQTTVASMSRARAQTSGEEATRSATAGAAAGIK